MNNGNGYKAEGKAILPPHPEDMRPGFDCCMQPPCVLKPPCQENQPQSEQKPSPTTIPKFRFQETQTQPNVFKDTFENSPQEIQKEYRNYLGSVAASLQDGQPQNQLYSYFYSQTSNQNEGIQAPQQQIGEIPERNYYEGANDQTLKMLNLQNGEESVKKAVEAPVANQETNLNTNPVQNEISDPILSQMKDLKLDSQNNILFLPPPLMYQPQQNMNLIPTSFLETSETNFLTGKKEFPLNRKDSEIEGFGFKQLNPNGVFEYDPNTGRRGRRQADLPDPEWDCLEKNVADLLHFICEQEVAKTFTKYCSPLIEQREVLVESFLYHDSTYQACQNMNLCPLAE